MSICRQDLYHITPPSFQYFTGSCLYWINSRATPSVVGAINNRAKRYRYYVFYTIRRLLQDICEGDGSWVGISRRGLKWRDGW